MPRLTYRSLVFFSASMLVAACGDEPSAESGADASGAVHGDGGGPDGADGAAPSSDGDAAVADDAGSDADGEAQVPASRVPHGSFEAAKRVSADGMPILRDEFDAEQVDHFVFTAKAGTFYEISTDRGRFSPDNVISLFDSERQVVASNDDGAVWPGDDYDARLVVRIPKDGDYFIKVEDLVTPPEFFRSGFTLLYYYLTVREIAGGAKGYAFWSAGQPLPQFEQDPESGYRFVTVLGTLDADVATVDFAGLRDNALIAHVHPGGERGDGSSVRDGRVTVTAPEGQLVAMIDRTRDQERIHPPVSDGSYHLSLERQGDRGSNPFFVLDLVLLSDNPSEQREAENGTAGGAELLTLSQGSVGRGLLLSRVQSGDVDYYGIAARQFQDITFNCEAESTGSGVRGLTVELRDAAESVIVAQTEGTDGLSVTYRVQTTGMYYLRLSSAAGMVEAIDPWVRCAVFVG